MQKFLYKVWKQYRKNQIILGFSDYYDRLLNIYVYDDNTFKFTSIDIESPYKYTIDPYEKLLLHKEISKLKTDSV